MKWENSEICQAKMSLYPLYPAPQGKWKPTPVFLPREPYGQRSLVGYSPRGHKELDKTEHTRSLFLRHTGAMFN